MAEKEEKKSEKRRRAKLSVAKLDCKFCSNKKLFVNLSNSPKRTYDYKCTKCGKKW